MIMERIRGALTYANVTATVALLLVLMVSTREAKNLVAGYAAASSLNTRRLS